MERDDPPKPGKPAPKAAASKAGDSPANNNVRRIGSARKSKVKPYERPRGGPAKQVSDLVPQIGRAAFRRFGFVQSSVVTRWPEIVGPIHAKVCAPEAIRFPIGEKSDGILQLVVLPAHAPLIQHVLPEIIERVNRFFGYKAVAKIKMRQGAVQPPSAEGRRAAPPSLKPIPMDLGEGLRDIGDPELRAVLESLARSVAHKEEQDQ
ncbi:DUF721 domain-containing protein [Erythrobacter sp. EC-HK427]|uniref:DUF721 domain-containing protein n=1 Tax=Erythrobacter sp. EC-HK427 TaxID=2038396 RepID=UPI0012578243|nr:DUF721 domain-containing protein [Erythrobacter sp. EC-HK427]VVT12089.1 conserved hypothetical protein [Erythrobacter sp. EC-HK427]